MEGKKCEVNLKSPKLVGQTYYKRMEKTLRQAGKTSERFGEKIMCLTRASTYWKKNHETKIADLINKRKEGDKLIQPLQCEQATPVMVGADVSTLYPSMDNIGSAEMAAKSIRESEVKFNNIDYQKLATYLTLTLGKEGLTEAGLGHVITLKINKKCNARSLAAASNKKEENWVHLDQSKLDEETKRDLMSYLITKQLIIFIK